MSDPLHPRILAALIAHQRADPGVCTCGWIWNGNGTHSGHVAEQLQPIIDDARAETAEAIVREIESTEHRCGDCGVLLDGTHIADIARQHGAQP